MRIVYIGSVEFSREVLKKLFLLKADVAGVLTPKRSRFNSDFADLSAVCRQHRIPCRHVKDINDERNLSWIRDKRPDIIFCFGFSQLLKAPLLSIPSRGVIGFHPARLPRNRGRHPLIWALALGMKKTASTFFFIGNGVDNGAILSQKDIRIAYHDDARTLYRKVTDTALRQVEVFLPRLERGMSTGIPQDDAKANYWRKRTAADGRIDFRMASRAIYNLVRALARPYPGASAVYNGEEAKVWRVVEKKCAIENAEPGKVLSVSGRRILVKCHDGAVLLTEHGFTALPRRGEYLS